LKDKKDQRLKKCLRCGNQWLSKVALPKKCPKCQSKYHSGYEQKSGDNKQELQLFSEKLSLIDQRLAKLERAFFMKEIRGEI
jgi:hypothetical protein